MIERWIILFIFVLDHLSPHQPRKLEYLCRLNVFFLLSFLFFQVNADFNYFFEIQAKTVGIYIIWNKSLDCWTKQKFLLFVENDWLFSFWRFKNIPLHRFWVHWLIKWRGGDGGVDTLTFLFPSFWLGTNTAETKEFCLFFLRIPFITWNVGAPLKMGKTS